MLKAKWIWTSKSSAHPYNQTILARKTFTLGEVLQGTLKITADSWYRVYLNGQWVNDGPCRSWPEHYQYDEMDVTAYLHVGENELRVIAKYWGTGTFHTRPQQPGLLAQLETTLTGGEKVAIVTDQTWQVAEALAWQRNTPKVSIQMEPQEYYDARQEDVLFFEPALAICGPEDGPWRDLHPRDAPLLTRQPYAFRSFREANLVKKNRDWCFSFPTARLAHPGLIEAQRNVSQCGGFATILEAAGSGQGELQFVTQGLEIVLDGQTLLPGKHRLSNGEHLLLLFVSEPVGHDKEKVFRIVDPPTEWKIRNPLQPDHANPWCRIPFPEYDFVSDDIYWPEQGLLPELQSKLEAYQQAIETLGSTVASLEIFRKELGDRAVCLPVSDCLLLDTHWRFYGREPLENLRAIVENPTGLMYDNPQVTTVYPHPQGNVELVYDLGAQNIGYYDLELIAPAGLEIDIYGVEYITPEGKIQHTYGNRNGVTYITRAGLNRFTSTKRRSGRYLFITLHNQLAPVQIRKVQLIESTYPVNAVGSFHCSDARLDQIWEISARTLKLCMEDTFTDCPLYEQTHWVGDARNESVFAYPVFGATDLGKRCITLTAQSLERYPIAGCQVPSGWDCLLPAWSFLWGISVWDYYQYSGDTAFVRQTWPAVIANLKGAEKLLDEHGLFSGHFWNMFDWSGIDDRQHTVLHNSMLLVGAIQVARKCAQLLVDEPTGLWLEEYEARLRTNINRWWDPQKKAYPDSLQADGRPSPSTSQHTSFLSVLYDIIEPQHRADALKNTIQPPEKMVLVGSPFAMMYRYEALEKAGRPDLILQSIYEAYLPMLSAEATTVWETFASSSYRPGDFPTRSHCHAWSSAPLYFLNRMILGVHCLQAERYEISPWLGGLEWARGAVATSSGPLQVEWRLEGESLFIQVRAPKKITAHYVENESTAGKVVVFTQWELNDA